MGNDTGAIQFRIDDSHTQNCRGCVCYECTEEGDDWYHLRACTGQDPSNPVHRDATWGGLGWAEGGSIRIFIGKHGSRVYRDANDRTYVYWSPMEEERAAGGMGELPEYIHKDLATTSGATVGDPVADKPFGELARTLGLVSRILRDCVVCHARPVCQYTLGGCGHHVLCVHCLVRRTTCPRCNTPYATPTMAQVEATTGGTLSPGHIVRDRLDLDDAVRRAYELAHAGNTPSKLNSADDVEDYREAERAVLDREVRYADFQQRWDRKLSWSQFAPELTAMGRVRELLGERVLAVPVEGVPSEVYQKYLATPADHARMAAEIDWAWGRHRHAQDVVRPADPSHRDFVHREHGSGDLPVPVHQWVRTLVDQLDLHPPGTLTTTVPEDHAVYEAVAWAIRWCRTDVPGQHPRKAWFDEDEPVLFFVLAEAVEIHRRDLQTVRDAVKYMVDANTIDCLYWYRHAFNANPFANPYEEQNEANDERLRAMNRDGLLPGPGEGTHRAPAVASPFHWDRVTRHLAECVQLWFGTANEVEVEQYRSRCSRPATRRVTRAQMDDAVALQLQREIDFGRDTVGDRMFQEAVADSRQPPDYRLTAWRLVSQARYALGDGHRCAVDRRVEALCTEVEGQAVGCLMWDEHPVLPQSQRMLIRQNHATYPKRIQDKTREIVHWFLLRSERRGLGIAPWFVKDGAALEEHLRRTTQPRSALRHRLPVALSIVECILSEVARDFANPTHTNTRPRCPASDGEESPATKRRTTGWQEDPNAVPSVGPPDSRSTGGEDDMQLVDAEEVDL